MEIGYMKSVLWHYIFVVEMMTDPLIIVNLINLMCELISMLHNLMSSDECFFHFLPILSLVIADIVTILRDNLLIVNK